MTQYDLSRAVWRKSRRSHANGECVEIASVDHVIAVRDSKDPGGTKLFVNPGDWMNLLDTVKSGAHDIL